MSEEVNGSRAGNLSVKLEGKLGFFANTNWFGQKPYTFAKAFLLATATSKLHPVSSLTLLVILPNITQFFIHDMEVLIGKFTSIITEDLLRRPKTEIQI